MPPEETVVEEAEDTVLPGEETPAEETHEGFVSDKIHEGRVNVQHKRFRDEERGRINAEERAATAERELNELKSTNAEVVIPPIPDKHSDSYDADMAARDVAIAAKTSQDAELEQRTEQKRKDDEARQSTENEALNKRVATFDSNLVSHGLNSDEVKAAAETFIGFGISTVFQDIILDDKDGPLMVKYFADNPIVAEQVNGMSTLDMVNHLNDEIRPKALLLKPQTSAAPEPPIVLDGGGSPETKESWEAGAVYE